MLHSPDHETTRQCPDTQDGEDPAIPNGLDHWRRNENAHARENVSHEIVDGDASGRFPGHEFGEHGSGHGEDEH